MNYLLSPSPAININNCMCTQIKSTAAFARDRAREAGTNTNAVMMIKILLQLVVASTALSSASAFTTPIQHASRINNGVTFHSVSSPVASTRGGFGLLSQEMSSDDNSESAAAPRKRRTRKDGKTFSPPVETATTTEPEETPAPGPAPAPAAPKTVVMQVRDIRDVVSGKPEPVVEEVVAAAAAAVEEEEDDDDDVLSDDEEWEYYDVDENGNEIIASDNGMGMGMGGMGQDDSLEQLLADARSMRKNQGVEVEEETSTMDKILSVIATIVTVDFFFVLGLLAWFLAGIFCSYVLKDDAVQIAFNMNFEGVTRPALTVLMAGSIAGGLGNKDDDEEEY